MNVNKSEGRTPKKLVRKDPEEEMLNPTSPLSPQPYLQYD